MFPKHCTSYFLLSHVGNILSYLPNCPTFFQNQHHLWWSWYDQRDWQLGKLPTLRKTEKHQPRKFQYQLLWPQSQLKCSFQFLHTRSSCLLPRYLGAPAMADCSSPCFGTPLKCFFTLLPCSCRTSAHSTASSEYPVISVLPCVSRSAKLCSRQNRFRAVRLDSIAGAQWSCSFGGIFH